MLSPTEDPPAGEELSGVSLGSGDGSSGPDDPPADEELSGVSLGSGDGFFLSSRSAPTLVVCGKGIEYEQMSLWFITQILGGIVRYWAGTTGLITCWGGFGKSVAKS